MRRQRSGLIATAEYSILAAVRTALAALPLRRAIKVGAAAGTLAMGLDRINRPIAMRNLEIAFPELSIERRLAILRGMYRNWGRMGAELAHAGDYTPGNVDYYAPYVNREIWERAARESGGRPIMIFTGHFGNFELLNLAHSMRGHRSAFVYRPVRNRLLDQWLNSLRSRYGTRLIARKGASREMMRAIRQNYIVCLPIDLDVRRGVFVDFFSMKACTTDSLARVAMATGAQVGPVFMIRDGVSERHRITIMEGIEIVCDGNREDAVIENTQRFSRALEQMIRRHPDHWNWIHRRWKTRPPGEERFY
jgi:KDO2-lipid IV(A) lauroyltransferase